ncbi:IS1096 element passenger TnpR family protein [Thermophilibacter mediterraneus]|uniref:IS1096 element passenger TnpR family protein n=1 Tax=Thermophilibacter mediterraneus TaxID=1871031 RepID=UPI000930593E|nr:hypothetical protein [Thermophilibacter mediterraneus]
MDMTLNERLDLLLTLALAYLRNGFTEFSDVLYQQVEAPWDRPLRTLADYDLVRYSPGSDQVLFTREGIREARGVVKYLQCALGPALGASMDEIKSSSPVILAEEVLDGAGPLTMAQLMTLVGSRDRDAARALPAVPLGRVTLEEPPEAYGRDADDARGFVLDVRAGAAYRTYRSYDLFESCERSLDSECRRRLLVPAGLTFLDLHVAIQLSMCWLDCQPFGFLHSNGRQNLLLGEREACGGVAVPPTRKRKLVERRASRETLGATLTESSDLTYAYGDEQALWEHRIRVVRVVRGAAPLGVQLMEGSGDAPPEGVRDRGEFEEFLSELYGSGRVLLQSLAGARDRGFAPFDLGVARRRLAGFEEARAAWQDRLDACGEPPLP